MSTELLGLIIGAVGTVLYIAVAVGIPALAVVALKFFKYKERELALQMEYRHKSEQHQDKQLAMEQRVQCLEDTVTRLDHDVRVHLGMPDATELLEAPADVARAAPAPVPARVR
jgi:hypothetical protein